MLSTCVRLSFLSAQEFVLVQYRLRNVDVLQKKCRPGAALRFSNVDRFLLDGRELPQ